MGTFTVNLSDSEFEQTIQKNPLVLVDFWAEWCPPCRAIAPTLDEIAQDLGSKLLVAKINVDQNPETPQRFGVRGIPTLILFKDGKEVDQIVGLRDKADLLANIQKYI